MSLYNPYIYIYTPYNPFKGTPNFGQPLHQHHHIRARDLGFLERQGTLRIQINKSVILHIRAIQGFHMGVIWGYLGILEKKMETIPGSVLLLLVQALVEWMPIGSWTLARKGRVAVSLLINCIGFPGQVIMVTGRL